jgi:hypothetical protein
MSTSRRRKSVRRNSRRSSLRRNFRHVYALVYHAIDPHFELRSHESFTAKNYRLVATVETSDLEEAYRLTNHIHKSWTKNKGVAAHHVPRPRSTSVGDVVAIVHEDDGAASVHLCAPAGWTRLGAFAVDELPALP